MKALSQFVVHVFDLVEAEGRSFRSALRGETERARSSLASLALAVAFLIVSVPLLVTGIWVLAAGILLWLEPHLTRPPATVVTALLLLAAAAACLWCFRVLSSRQVP
jgi:uncharacterized membrane protein YqjE